MKCVLTVKFIERADMITGPELRINSCDSVKRLVNITDIVDEQTDSDGSGDLFVVPGEPHHILVDEAVLVVLHMLFKHEVIIRAIVIRIVIWGVVVIVVFVCSFL